MTLYKYLSPNRIDVLENQYLRATPANNQNDIFEMRPYFENIVDPTQKDELFEGLELNLTEHFEKLYNDLSTDDKDKIDKDKFLKEIIRIENTAQGKELIEQLKPLVINILNNSNTQIQEQIYQTNIQLTGIISLSETYNSNKMWGHYGDSHRGFIIGFNSNHYFFNRPRSDEDEYFRIRKVIYDNNNKIKTLYGIDGADLLLRKSVDWVYEIEWRLLIPLFLADEVINKNNETIHLVKFPTDCIESIIFGIKSNNELKDSIHKIIKKKKLRSVKIGQMFVDHNEPKMDVKWLNAKN